MLINMFSNLPWMTFSTNGLSRKKFQIRFFLRLRSNILEVVPIRTGIVLVQANVIGSIVHDSQLTRIASINTETISRPSTTFYTVRMTLTASTVFLVFIVCAFWYAEGSIFEVFAGFAIVGTGAITRGAALLVARLAFLVACTINSKKLII